MLPASLPSDPALIVTQLNLLNGYKFVGAVGADPLRPGGRFPLDGGSANLLSDQSVGSQYDKAVIEATYERPRFRLLEDAYCPAEAEYLRYTETLPPQIGMDVLVLVPALVPHLGGDGLLAAGGVEHHQRPRQVQRPQ